MEWRTWHNIARQRTDTTSWLTGFQNNQMILVRILTWLSYCFSQSNYIKPARKSHILFQHWCIMKANENTRCLENLDLSFLGKYCLKSPSNSSHNLKICLAEFWNHNTIKLIKAAQCCHLDVTVWDNWLWILNTFILSPNLICYFNINLLGM